MLGEPASVHGEQQRAGASMATNRDKEQGGGEGGTGRAHREVVYKLGEAGGGAEQGESTAAAVGAEVRGRARWRRFGVHPLDLMHGMDDVDGG